MNHSLSLSLYCYNSLAHFITHTNTHTRTYKHTPVDTHKCLLSSGAVDKTERRDHQNACCWTLLRQSLITQPKSLWVPSCCFLLRLLHSLCLFFLHYLFLFLFFLNSDVLMSLCSLQKSAVSTTVARQTHLGCLRLRPVQHQELLELVFNAS